MKNQIRREIIRQIYEAKSGHPGGSLSVVEILVALTTAMGEDDILVMSKGHAAPALYAYYQATMGGYTGYKLRKFGNVAQGHPSVEWLPRVNTSTGSLGQGFSWSVGAALALRDTDNKVYCIIGDGEAHEGIIKEAAQVAGFYRLGNLIAIMDFNGYQSDRASAMMINPADEWRSYGWFVTHCDGHDVDSLTDNINLNINDRPVLVIAHTVKGRGVSFMEGPDWHGSVVLSQEQYEQAMAELE